MTCDKHTYREDYEYRPFGASVLRVWHCEECPQSVVEVNFPLRRQDVELRYSGKPYTARKSPT